MNFACNALFFLPNIFLAVIETLTQLQLDEIQLRKSALVLRSINHKLRQQILRLLHQQSKMTVTELYIQLRLEQSVASQHLAILRKAGIVTTKREGKFIHYSVDYAHLEQVHLVTQRLTQG